MLNNLNKNINNVIIKVLAFTLPFIAIVFQGSYFPMQYISLLCGLLVLLILYSLNHRVYVNKHILILSVFIAVLYFVPVLTEKADLSNAILECLRLLCFGFVIVLCYEFFKNKMLAGIYAGLTAVSFLGILSYLKLLTFKGWAVTIDGVYRMQSSIGYANATAVYCGIGVVLSYIYRKKSKNLKSLHTLFLVINSIGLVLTFSRLGIVCFIISILIILCFKYRHMLYAVIIGFVLIMSGVGYLFLCGKQKILLGSSLVSRLIYWQDGFSLFLKHPFGIGAGEWENSQYLVQTSGYIVKFVHNGLLQIAIDGGIMVMISFVALLVIGFIGLYKRWRDTTEDLYLGLMASFLLIALHSIVDIDLNFSATLIILGIIIAFGAKRQIEIKRLPVILVCTLLIAVSIFFWIFYTLQNKKINIYQTLITKNIVRPNDVLTISKLYNMAYTQGNIEDMYKWSKKWVESAPRQQNAYDAYLVSLDRMIEKTAEKSYILEKDALYEKMQDINKTTNSLCRYYDGYTNIVLPKKK